MILGLLGFVTILGATSTSNSFEYAQRIESTLLKPLLEGQNTDLISQWTAAVQTGLSDDELLKEALMLEAAYTKWNLEREQVINSVFQTEELRLAIFDGMSVKSLGTLSTVSKSFLSSLERYIGLKYSHGTKVNWSSLINDAASCTFSKCPVLYRYLIQHWPRSDDELTSALLTKGLSLLKLSGSLCRDLPYIPGYFELNQALFNAKVIRDGEFPFNAFYYEDVEVVEKFGKGLYYFSDVKALLQSGDPKAMRNFAVIFPKSMLEDGKEVPKMRWDGLEPVSSLLLAIFYHKDTDHEALMSHLATVEPEFTNTIRNQDFVHLLMESSLSSADIFKLVGKRPDYRVHFGYGKRFVEMIPLCGYENQKIDLDALRAEQFRGPYSEQILESMKTVHFYKIALLAGADDEFIMDAVLNGQGMFADFFIFSALIADRSVELVEFLIKRRMVQSLSHITSFTREIPTRHLSCLFSGEDFVNAYMDTLIRYSSFQQSSKLRTAMKLLSPEQLAQMLKSNCVFGDELLEIVFFDELIKQLNTDKRYIIEAYLVLHDDNPAFTLALLLQSIKDIELICRATDREEIAASAQDAAFIKMKF